jgi:hypothetical protein
MGMLKVTNVKDSFAKIPGGNASGILFFAGNEKARQFDGKCHC